MRENGTTSETSTNKKIKEIIFKIYWEQFCLPINWLVFHIKFTILKVQRRSNQSLISPRKKRIDTKKEMERLEIGRDNMEEFVRIVPDECLIDLSFRWYCND